MAMVTMRVRAPESAWPEVPSLPWPLEVKHTFISCVVPAGPDLHRRQTCPPALGDDLAEMSTDDEASPDSHDDGDCADDATPDTGDSDCDGRQEDASTRERPSWACLLPYRHTGLGDRSSPASSRASSPGSLRPLRCPPRWSELSDEDDSWAPVARMPRESEARASNVDAAAKWGRATQERTAKQRQRPTLPKVTRESRVQQVWRQIDEFCTLDFDLVEPCGQAGLTHRMRATLSSLAMTVAYWDGERKHEETAFSLLGLLGGDMAAIGLISTEAGQLLDQLKYHDAYRRLCAARPWLTTGDADEREGALEALRAAEQQRAADAEACCEQEEALWSTVRKAADVAAAAAQGEASWSAAARRSERKPADAAAAAAQAGCEDEASWSAVARRSERKPADAALAAVQEEAASWSTVARRSERKPAASTAAAGAQGAAPSTPASPSVVERGPTPPWKRRDASGGTAPASVAGSAAKATPRPAPVAGPAAKAPLRPSDKAASRTFVRRIPVGLEEGGAFKVCKRLIGPGGERMKHISAEAAGAKVWVTGQGAQAGSKEPLTVVLSATSSRSMERAASLVHELVKTVHEEHRQFCQAQRRPLCAA